MDNATFVIDGHVHLYPVYRLNTAVECGIRNLTNAALKYVTASTTIIPVWLLTERSDANFFNQIRLLPAHLSQDDIKFKVSDPLTIKVEKNHIPILFIFAGRQLVTKEGLEVLSLISNLSLPDRQESIEATIRAVQDSGGIPGLNWAPGKWFFQRGKIIEYQIQHQSPSDLLIGETTLRHTLWPEPKLIRQARKRGFKVIAGSDPLPFKDEEKAIGEYGFLMAGKFDPEKPAQSLRNLIRSQTKITIIGKRNDVFTFIRRQYQIMREKKTRQ